MDEVQESSPETARPFWRAVQEAKTEAAPFLILAAGTPDAPRRLRDAGTLGDGRLEECRVGRLSPEAAAAALREPAREAGRPFTDEAAEFLLERAENYPYFVQLFGRDAWEAAARADSRGITLAAAEQGAVKSEERKWHLYRGRYEEAEHHRIEPVLKPLGQLFADHHGRLSDAALDAFVRRFADRDSIPLDAPALQQELSDLGVVGADRPGEWEPGLAGFVDYLLRHA